MAYKKHPVSVSEMGSMIIKDFSDSVGLGMVDLPVDTLRTALESWNVSATDEEIEQVRTHLKDMLKITQERAASGWGKR